MEAECTSETPTTHSTYTCVYLCSLKNVKVIAEAKNDGLKGKRGSGDQAPYILVDGYC